MYRHERSLVTRLAGKPFVILGVNSDKDKAELKKALAKEGVSWRSWWDGGSTAGPIASKWNVSAWPTVYLLDHKGVIRYKEVYEEKELDQAIDSLLQELEKAAKE